MLLLDRHWILLDRHVFFIFILFLSLRLYFKSSLDVHWAHAHLVFANPQLKLTTCVLITRLARTRPTGLVGLTKFEQL